MSQIECPECPNCGMCHKKGLPILLTRYAVATGDDTAWYRGRANKQAYISNAPDMREKTQFDPCECNGEPISLGAYTYYTLRRLREGFIYVYNPKAVPDPSSDGNGIWRCYQVTEEQYLNPVPLVLDPEDAARPPGDAGKPARVKPCVPEKNGVFAACITLPVADLLSVETIWIALSNVRWTQKILDRYTRDENQCRTKTMRAFDVKAWLASGQHKHAGLIDEVDKHVAEFSPEVNTLAFDYLKDFHPWGGAHLDFGKVASQYGLETPPPCKGDWGKAASVLVSEFIRARAKNPALAMPDADKLRELAQSCVVTSAEVFGRDCKRLHEKAAFLALDDPASIARDLSELLDNRYIAFTRYTDFGRPLVTSKAIEQACMAIHDQAELKWLDKRQKKLEMFHSAIWISNSGNSYSRNAKYVGTPSEIPPEKPSIMTDANWTEFNELHMYLDTDEEVGERDASGIWTPAQRTRCEQIRANRVNELAQARDKAWKTYAKHLKNQGKACDEFRETYEKEKAVFNDAIILPLSEAHVKWTSGKTLAAVSRYMFDKEELRAGVIFAMMISKIIGGTQKYTPTATLYEKWLGDEAWMEKKDDTTNLLWKALLVNNSHMEAGLAKATKDLQAEFPSNRYSAEAMAHAAEREKALDSNEQVEQAVTARKEAWKEDASFGDGLKEGSAGKAFLGIGEKLVGRYFDIYGKLEETMWEAIAATLKGETHTVNARGKSGALQQQWSDCITDVVNRLVGVLSGPAVNVINSRTQMGTYAPLLVHCGAISRAPYFFVQCYGTTAQMAESILWTMQREGLGLAEMAENQKRALRSAIQQRLTALQINGVNLNGQAPRLIPVAISFRALEKFIKSGKPAAQQAALFRLIAGMERMPYLAMEAMRAGRFDEAVRIAQANGAQLREIMRTRWDLRLRVWGSGLIKHSAVQAVVAVFSVAEITGGAEKIVKAQRLGHGAAEAITRLVAACLSFAQTLFIAAEKSLSALPTMFLRFGVRDPATAALWWADKAEWAGRFVSGVLVVASGFMALEAFSERDYMMSALYGISAITAGITLALSIAGVAGGPAGLLLFIASILIIAAIEIAKGDPFENWMKKCWFGTEEPKYDTIAQEMEEFSDAFAKAQIA